MKKDPIELSAGIVMLWSSRWEKNKENKAVMEGDVLTRNITNWDGSDMAQDMKALQQLIQTSQNIIGTHSLHRAQRKLNNNTSPSHSLFTWQKKHLRPHHQMTIILLISYAEYKGTTLGL